MRLLEARLTEHVPLGGRQVDRVRSVDGVTLESDAAGVRVIGWGGVLLVPWHGVRWAKYDAGPTPLTDRRPGRR